MTRIRSPFVYLFLLITISLNFYHLKCEARDIIHATDPLSNRGETLVSAGNIFELGFFSSEGNEKSSRYVGIWYYNLVPRTIVWVASRDSPLVDSCGSFGIKEDGNIKIWCSNGDVIPVTSLESSGNLNRTLQLLDSGNLVLVDGQSGSTLWQSFDDPTDTFLPGMKLNDEVKLISWKSPTDPGTGNYTFRQDQRVYIIQKRSAVHWKSFEPGPFGASDEIPNFVDQMLSNDSDPSQSLGNRTHDRSISYGNYTWISHHNNSRLVLNSSGEIRYYNLRDSGNWSLLWLAPMDACSIYNACGKFGICNFKNKPICICPLGFKPASSEDWEAGQYSEGCDREYTKCSREDTFLKISHIKVKVGGEVTPFDQAKKEEECKKECVNNCICQGYSYRDANISERETGRSAPKCWIWTTDPVNLHQDNTDGSLNISLRLYSSTAALVNTTGNGLKPPKRSSGKRYVIVITVVIAGVILGSCWSCILYKKRRMARQSGNRGITGDTPVPFPNQSERQANHLMQENDKLIDVPFYNLDIILSATDNFSNENKLGQGGFGPVYKGNLPGGHEIAVKRLSSCSVQGIEEFLNEVVLIAKLQHRNLVRLLGYCIKDNEKILLYEYMPNRSLDAFLFDQRNSLLLDWTKRFDIILGIARGLLYLHQDSRLTIIHRDLKTSNILLDEDMTPKISDFGLARIVEGKGTEASTNKVVGTYGYMSPEYALDGKFSDKSDVFSFGVVMLEILSGKKNNGFYNPHEFLNLLGYAWRLWSENKALDLIDPTLLESCERSQVMKCINIGLLCVQEDPNERPSMSTIVITLGSGSAATLPLPTQPAFVVRRRVSSTSSSSTKPDMASVNELTVSMAEEGR